jgi:hypothetical protein
LVPVEVAEALPVRVALEELRFLTALALVAVVALKPVHLDQVVLVVRAGLEQQHFADQEALAVVEVV